MSWSRARAGALAASLFVFSFACAQVAYSIVMIDPNDQKWFWIAMLATISLGTFAWRVHVAREFRIDSLDMALAAAFLYAALSLAWTPDRGGGLLFLIKFAAAGAIFIYLKDFGTLALFRRLAAWTTFAAGVAIFLVYTQPGAWGGFHNRNFVTEYLLLALPFCGAYIAISSSLARRSAAILIMLGILWYLVFDNPSRLEFAIVPGTIACLLGLALYRRAGWQPVFVLAALSVIGMALLLVFFWDSPLASDKNLRGSIFPRVALALDTLLIWLDAPLFGHGAASFQYLFPAYQEDHIHRLGIPVSLFDQKQIIAGAAHNEYFQLLSEFGLAGAAIAGVFIWRVVVIARHGPPFGPLQYAALVAVIVWAINAALEFPLQNPATLVLALASIAILVANGYREEMEERRIAPGRTAAVAAISVLVAGAAGVQILVDRLTSASKYNALSHFRLATGDVRGTYLAIRESIMLNPWDYQTRLTLFLSAVILMETESWSAPTWQERLRRQPFISPQMNDLYKRALSGGQQPAVAFARVYYLVKSGHYPDYKAEIAEALAFLRRNASRIGDTWMMDALCGLLFGNRQQIADARAAGEKIGMPKDRLDMMRQMEAIAGTVGDKLFQPELLVQFEVELPGSASGVVRRVDTAK